MKETLTSAQLSMAHSMGRISKKEAHDLRAACRTLGRSAGAVMDRIALKAIRGGKS